MKVGIKLPEPFETGTIQFRFNELSPSAIAELIDCLDDADPRVKQLKDLWGELTQ